jgi:PTH1 family peptidyl-tRNA hydrolase
MKKKEKIKLVFGLGNEGKEFYSSRHNIGKEIIDFYIEERKEEKSFYFAKYNHLILASNKGYMNESGKSVKEALKFFKLKPENLLVIHDDADLLFPFFKVSFASGSGGHKGVESIFKEIKSKNFWRFRIGIQKKKRVLAGNLVLKKWDEEEKKVLDKIKKEFKIILEKLEEKLPNELNLSKDYFLKLNERKN